MTAATADVPPTVVSTVTSGVSAGLAEADAGARFKRSAQTLAVAVIDLAAAKATSVVDGYSDQLENLGSTLGSGLGPGLLSRLGSGAGVGMSAVVGAGQAWLAGNNPIWGAVKGGWQALGTGAKVGIVLLLILLAVLSPVALLVALVVLLIVAMVRASKS